MSRIEWNTPGERFYETGVDRGVLYVKNRPGVPWNGLISVNEAPTGGEEKPYYLDGIKRLSLSASEEFAATIEAFTYPEDFNECDGSAHVMHGLYATQQVREFFNLAYRTMIGNDTRGVQNAYKIHLVYNARVAPTSRAYTTLGDEVDPFNFSWPITSTTTYMEGLRPTPHYVIDSRTTPKQLLQRLESILYGTETDSPRMPNVDEVHFLFTTYSASIFDGALFDDEVFAIFDGEFPDSVNTSTIDGGVA